MADPNILETPNPLNPPLTPAAPVIDVQAQINQGIATFQADLSQQFKAATGHEDIKSFADAKLLAVFGKPQVTMFELAGIVGKHLS